MSANTVTVKRNLTTITDRRLSPALWADCPILDLLEDPTKGFFFFDDFINTPQMISDQDVAKYASYIDTGVTIKQLPLLHGILEVAGNDADNDEGSITTGGNTGTLALISDTAADAYKLWFECRFKKASVADNALALLVGLHEEGGAIADALVNDTGVAGDKDHIGFTVHHDNGEELNFGWKKAGQTAQEIANIATLAADTYIRAGFLYDPGAPGDRKIQIFINNLRYGTFITAAQIAAATFPDGEELALLLATKVGAAAESKFQMDWWAVAQLYDPS